LLPGIPAQIHLLNPFRKANNIAAWLSIATASMRKSF